MAKPKSTGVANYNHPNERSLMRPEVGVQGQFKKKKPAQKYRYDSSLAPALDWDGKNPAREQGKALLGELEAGLAEVRETLDKELAALDSKLPLKEWRRC
jgi:adenine-specific DNA-methyltransferase